MNEFDPFGWLETYFSTKMLHIAIRVGVAIVLLSLLIYTLSSYDRYWFKPLWAVETIFFLVYLVSYAIRIDPVHRSRGAREIVIPLAGGISPFALLFTPPHPFITSHLISTYIVFIWMSAATSLTVWGLWTLRRSFSITVEARELVTGGPYRFVRHPMYLGEILTAAAVTVLRLSIVNVVIFVLFMAIQLFRSKMEEKKLARVFPFYRAYASQKIWLWPQQP